MRARFVGMFPWWQLGTCSGTTNWVFTVHVNYPVCATGRGVVSNWPRYSASSQWKTHTHTHTHLNFPDTSFIHYDLETVEPKRLDEIRKYMGFVPQDDLVYSDLTVRENIEYSSCLKRGQFDKALIENIITNLGLSKVADKIVGSIENRGISGGQRKRVNIGMELAGLHSIIFMDEPTSGLDSSGSYEVMNYCKLLTRQLGLCIVCVVHQPKYSTFMLFDHLTLLKRPTDLVSKPTSTVFSGSPSEALAYFIHALDFKFKIEENPADMLMDIITYSKEIDLSLTWQTRGLEWMNQYRQVIPNTSVFIKPLNEIIRPYATSDVYPSHLIKYFDQSHMFVSIKEIKKFMDNQDFMSAKEFNHRVDEVFSSANLSERYNHLIGRMDLIKLVAPTAIFYDSHVDRWKQFRVDALVVKFVKKLLSNVNHISVNKTKWKNTLDREMLLMAYLNHHNQPHMIDIFDNNTLCPPRYWYKSMVLMQRKLVNMWRSSWIIQLLVTIAASLIVGFIHGAEGNIDSIPSNIVMAMACIGVLGMVTHLRTFYQDKDVMTREIKNGLELSLIYITYSFIDLIWILIMPTTYFIIYTGLIFPRANVGWYILNGILVQWWASGMAYIVSFLNIGSAWINLVGVFISIIFGAFINGLNNNIKYVDLVSYNRWALQSLVLQEINQLFNVIPDKVYGIVTNLDICSYDKVEAISALIFSRSLLYFCSLENTKALIIQFALGGIFRVVAWMILWIHWNLSMFTTNAQLQISKIFR